jgi:hypothetical protein
MEEEEKGALERMWSCLQLPVNDKTSLGDLLENRPLLLSRSYRGRLSHNQ